MNEKLKKLIKKAGGEVKITGSVHVYIDKSNLDVEKFAELIVRECIIAVETHGGMCGQTSSTKIKEHFGVEE